MTDCASCPHAEHTAECGAEVERDHVLTNCLCFQHHGIGLDRRALDRAAREQRIRLHELPYWGPRPRKPIRLFEGAPPAAAGEREEPGLMDWWDKAP